MDFGNWNHYSARNEWDDTLVTGYLLRSDVTDSDDLIAWVYFRCYGDEFSSYIIFQNGYISSDYRGNVWVNYRAGTADLIAEYWQDWDDDKLYPVTQSERRTLAKTIADNPGLLLFRWRNSGSSDWISLRFTDTTGLKKALGTLPCY